MSEEDVIDRAVTALGSGKDDDFVIAPTRHAEELSTKAPALARLLRSAKVEALARQYERLDAEALEAQRKFSRAIEQANAAVLATAVLSAAMMVVGLVLSGGAERALLIILGLLSVSAGAFASMWLFRVREGGLLEAWMSARASAETRRLAYFATLLGIRSEELSEIPLELLKLEYFRRYQLDVQTAYYKARRQRHKKSAERTLMLGGLAVALASIAAGAAGFLGAAFETAWVSLAALGIVGASLGSFASMREAVNQDRRNAERYGRTLAALEELRGRLDEVRAGAATGLSDVTDEFVAAVHEQLSLEHRQWLEGGESTRSTIVKLNEILAKAEEQRTAKLQKPPGQDAAAGAGS